MNKRQLIFTLTVVIVLGGCAAISDSPQINKELRKDFCGFSTFGRCSSDIDCMKGGCSGQACQSRYEKPVITICDMRQCYDAKAYGLGCKCIRNKCQWAE